MKTCIILTDVFCQIKVFVVPSIDQVILIILLVQKICQMFIVVSLTLDDWCQALLEISKIKIWLQLALHLHETNKFLTGLENYFLVFLLLYWVCAADQLLKLKINICIFFLLQKYMKIRAVGSLDTFQLLSWNGLRPLFFIHFNFI